MSRYGRVVPSLLGLAVLGVAAAVAHWVGGRPRRVTSAPAAVVRFAGTLSSAPGQLNAPGGIAIGADERIIVADSGNDRLQVFKADGQLAATWGRQGREPGEFRHPGGLAVHEQALFIADTGNDRIQKLAADGRILLAWGRSGSGPGEFRAPASVAVDSRGSVYVADSDNGRIQHFTEDGGFIAEWTVPSAGTPARPAGIAVDLRDGTVFVSDPVQNRIHHFTGKGRFIGAWSTIDAAGHGLGAPTGLTAGRDGMILAVGRHAIRRYDRTGRLLHSWGSGGVGDGYLDRPEALAVASSGAMFVADTGNNRVQAFRSDGSVMAEWGNGGRGDGEFRRPLGMAVDDGGAVYVVDSANARVQKLGADGRFISAWGHSGTAPGEFINPAGAAVGPDGSVYIADSGNHRIQKFTASGRFLLQWGSRGSDTEQLRAPAGVAVGGDTVYVADTGNHRIQAYSSSGEFRHHWGWRGTADGEFRFPSGVAAGADGVVYVADTSNNRIQAFSPDGRFLRQWGRTGSQSRDLNRPSALAVARDGTVAVVQAGRATIQVYTPQGELLWAFPPPAAAAGPYRPRRGVAVHDGRIYATDVRSGRIDVAGVPLGRPAIVAREIVQLSLPSPETPPAAPAEPVAISASSRDGFSGWRAAFSAGASGAATVEPLRLEAGIAISESLYPHLWWPDGNHASPGGTGFLGLVAVYALTRPVDLTGATWRVRLRTLDPGGNPGLAYAGPSSSSGTRLVPWFQTFDRRSGKWLNFAAIGAPVDTSAARGQWSTTEVTPAATDWVCLGSTTVKVSFYGCAAVDGALQSASDGIGFILFPLDRQLLPVGRVEFAQIEVRHPDGAGPGR